MFTISDEILIWAKRNSKKKVYKLKLESYLKFVYPKDSFYDKNFLQQLRRLENDHNRLMKLSDSIEKVRLDVLRKYNRI